MKLENRVSEQINDIRKENLEKLAQLFPSIIKDGQVDFKALKEELGEFEEVKEERYEFTWAGKQNAKKKVQEDVGARTLKYIEEDSKNPDTTENLYIEGDNLEVLKLLRQNYYGSIKMIYIDPPYNTDGDFVYNDSFKMTKEENDLSLGYIDEDNQKLQKNKKDGNRYHANWLNMMYPRLKIARDLLTDDGVIFISIDDNEVGNLKKICESSELFGEDNYIGLISVENNPKGRKNSSHISVSSEFLLIYAKNKKKSFFLEVIPKNASDMTKDENGNYVHNSGKRILVGENDFNPLISDEASEKNYSVYYNIEKKEVYLKTEKFNEEDSDLINKGYKKYHSYNKNKLTENTYTKTKFLELFSNGALDIKENKIYEKNFNDTIRMKSQLSNRKYEAIVFGKKQEFSLNLTTTGASTFLKTLFGVENNLFENPKSVDYIKILIKLLSEKNFYVLDFFSGSATTAHAVMQLNAEDGGNRKFIMTQLNELTYDGKKEKYIDDNGEERERYIINEETGYPIVAKDSEARKEGFYTICEIGKERIRRAGELIKKEIEESNRQLQLGEEPKKVPDIGFKVFRTADTNINWKKIREVSKDNVMKFDDPDMLDFTLGFNDKDVVYEVLLRQRDLPLSEKLVTLTDIGSRTYLYADSYLVCLETNVTEELIEKLAELNPLPIKFIFRDSAFGSKIGLKEETFRKLKTLVEKNSGLTKKAYTVEFI